MTEHNNKLTLLRRFSIACLLAMLVTAFVLVFLYRRDQLAEYRQIAVQLDERTADSFIHMYGRQLNAFVAASQQSAGAAEWTKPVGVLLPSPAEMLHAHDIVKLKLYDRSGMTIYSPVPDEIGKPSRLHADLVARALAGETTHGQEFRDTFVGASGEMHDVYLAQSCRPLVYADKLIGVIEIYRDVTPLFRHLAAGAVRIPLFVFGGFASLYFALFFYIRRVELEVSAGRQALLESESRRRLLEQQKLVQTSLDGFFVARAQDGRLLEANTAFGSMLGYAHEELLEMNLSDLEACESPGEVEAHIRKIVETGYDRFETCHRHKQGHAVDVEVSVSHSEWDGGVNFVFVRDITERKRMEHALAASEREFRSLAESSPDYIIRHDLEHRIRYLNTVLMRESGFGSAADVIGKCSVEVWPDRRFDAMDEAAARAIRTGEKVTIELCLPAGSRGSEYRQIFVVPELGADGRIIGTLAFGRDITERKLAEQQLQKLSVYLQTVREQEKTQLAREVHDEVGSILSALKIEIHMLDRGLSEEQKKMPLFARVESMSELFDDALKAMRRIVTGLRPTVLEDLGLMAALEWQADQFQSHTGIACRVVCVQRGGWDCEDCKICEQTKDRELSVALFRIFQESLTNVARHSGATRVEVELQPDEHEIVLSICDDGCGLPDGHVIATTSNGLRGMRERVEQLNGEIAFGQPPDGGLRVTAKIPISP